MTVYYILVVLCCHEMIITSKGVPKAFQKKLTNETTIGLFFSRRLDWDFNNLLFSFCVGIYVPLQLY